MIKKENIEKVAIVERRDKDENVSIMVNHKLMSFQRRRDGCTKILAIHEKWEGKGHNMSKMG